MINVCNLSRIIYVYFLSISMCNSLTFVIIALDSIAPLKKLELPNL